MIEVRFHPELAAPAFAYRVAGGELLADRPLSWLSALAGGERMARLPPRGQWSSPVGDPLFAGRAFLARRERQLECRRVAAGFELEVAELGRFAYQEKEGVVRLWASTADADPELLAEVLLGPLLALALAQRGVFLLHASACELEGATWLFLGESGQGKSTLAARMGGRQLADDQAAVEASSHLLLPDFPQPKLDPSRLPALLAVGRRPLAGIAMLQKAAANAEPALLPSSPLVAAAGILRHTTAARCFDQELLRCHLDFAAGLVAEVPCFTLVYPHHQDAPKKIGALLARA